MHPEPKTSISKVELHYRRFVDRLRPSIVIDGLGFQCWLRCRALQHAVRYISDMPLSSPDRWSAAGRVLLVTGDARWASGEPPQQISQECKWPIVQGITAPCGLVPGTGS